MIYNSNPYANKLFTYHRLRHNFCSAFRKMSEDNSSINPPNEENNDSNDHNIPTSTNTTYITLSPPSTPDNGRKKKSKKKKKTPENDSPPISDDDRDQSLSSTPESKNEEEDAPIDATLSLKLRDENEIMKKIIERKHLEEESDSQMSSSPGSENGVLQIQR